MRWLLSLAIALATALCCNLAWAQWHGWSFTWWRGSAESRGEVRYADLSGASASPFVELDPGLRLLEHERGWAYHQALFLPDIDGDGCADLAMAGRRFSTCGNDVEGNLEIYSGAHLMPLGEYSGYASFLLEVVPSGEILEQRHHGWRNPEIRIYDDPRRRAPELRAESEWLDDMSYAGDLDRDGLADVAKARTSTADATGSSVGSVTVLSGSDGHVVWTALGGGQEWFGWDVAPAGDWNFDGTPDVAVLSEHAIAILSGVDGETLAEGQVSPIEELRSLSVAGDLDGDRRTDFRCGIDAGSVTESVFYSSATWKPLDVAAGWQVLWSANQGDLDRDGLDDLVVGRWNPATGDRRMSLYSLAGLVDVRFVGQDEPAWVNPGRAGVGRFRDHERWYALLPLGGDSWDDAGSVIVYPGS